MNRTTRLALTGVLTGALAASTLPVLVAGSAQAAAVTLTPAQAQSALRAAVSASTAGYSTVGGRSTGIIDLQFGGITAASASVVLSVDAARRNARIVTDFGDLLPDEFLGGDACATDEMSLGINEFEVVSERKKKYASLGTPPSRTVRKARALVKRPNATWKSTPTRSTMASTARANDLGVGSAENAALSQITSATRADLTSGVRYTVDYTGFFSDGGTLVIDLDTAGRIVASTTTEEYEGTTQRGRSRTVYAKQNVLAPVAANVVTGAKLKQGCRAANTEKVVLQAAREVRNELNARARATDRKVKVGKVRARISAKLRDAGPSLNVRDNDIAGGTIVVGKNKLLTKPIVRRVLVVDGWVVVRKGR